MSHKIAEVSFWSVAALFISLCPVALQAQGTTAPATPTAKPMQSKVTVTGCLQKGDSADEFAIAGKNGKTWELRSKTVKLDITSPKRTQNVSMACLALYLASRLVCKYSAPRTVFIRE